MLPHLLLLALAFSAGDNAAGDDHAVGSKPEAEHELSDLLADRPGFTTPSGVVDPGALQFESGYAFESANESGARMRTHYGFQTTVKFGLTRRLEVRFSNSGYCWKTGPYNVHGPSDNTFGVKFKLMEQQRLWPEISLIGGLSMPVRGSAFTSGGHDPAFTLSVSKDLARKFSVGGNINAASVTDPSGRYYASGASITAAHPLRKGVSGYAEIYRTSIGRGGDTASVTDAGLYRNIGRNCQIDIEAGHTVSGVRPSWFAGVGFVIRAPHRLLFR